MVQTQEQNEILDKSEKQKKNTRTLIICNIRVSYLRFGQNFEICFGD